MRQKGFATLEVILMILVIAILASIAVPRFSAVSASANTAKIQADLSTIDTAIALYYVDYGEYPKSSDKLSKLNGYLQNTDLKPPTGSAYINGEETAISGDYGFKDVDGSKVGEVQAALGSNTAEDFAVKKTDKE